MMAMPVLKSHAIAFDLPAHMASNGKLPEAMRWCLTCIQAEGLAPAELASVPMEVRDFEVADGVVFIGRQHQPEAFEALLSKSPSCLNFISRTHIQLEVNGTAGLTTTNISSNPV